MVPSERDPQEEAFVYPWRMGGALVGILGGVYMLYHIPVTTNPLLATAFFIADAMIPLMLAETVGRFYYRRRTANRIR